MAKLPFVTIVSLNWNSVQDSLALLSSIARQDYPKTRYEIIVVDSESVDGSVEKIKKRFPKTKIIELPKNVGVWVRNFAFRQAQGEIIITLDSDAYLIRNDTLTRVVNKIQQDHSIGILGVKVINKRSGEPEYSSLRLNFFTGAISTYNPDIETTQATWVPFILSAFTKKTLRKVGMLEHNFAYGEDLNFCLRIRKAGLKILYWPEIYIYHFKRKSTKVIGHSIRWHHYYKSLFRNIYGYGNWLQAISVSLFQLFIVPLFNLLSGKKTLLRARWWGFWWNITYFYSHLWK